MILRSFFRLGGALALLALAPPAAAQYDNPPATYPTQKRITVSATKFPEARTAARSFIQQRAVRVLKQQETPQQLTTEFALPASALGSLDSLAAALGYVLENNLNTQNVEERVQTLRDEETDARTRLERLETELRQLTAARRPDTAQLNLQRSRLDNAASALRRVRSQLAAYDANARQTYVSLQVFDEITFPTANHNINFVNMPGVEAGLLRLENPEPNVRSRFYRGYSVKYLFTRGKSYFNLGVYKPTSTTGHEADSAFVSELFIINFGQDFYPRHLGRGHRKFLNAYTTYQVGGFILNRRNDDNQFAFNANLGLGLELLKTKHVLLDTKASYFVPLNHLNRDLRGLLFQGAFNFVF